MKIYKIIFLLLFLNSNCLSSEMTDAINVTPYHNQGFRGQHVKVAIIDSDWSGWSKLEQNGVHITATAKDNNDTSALLNPLVHNIGNFGHGAGMVLTLHEIAPEAEIYLVEGSVRLSSAGARISGRLMAWFKAQRIRIISVSLDPMVVFHIYGSTVFSGTDAYCIGDHNNDTIGYDECVDAGILVCAIAGNQAQNIHSASLIRQTASGPGYMSFPDGNEYIDFTVYSENFRIPLVIQNNQGNNYTCTATAINGISVSQSVTKNPNRGYCLFDKDDFNGTQTGNTIRIQINRTSGTTETLNVLFNINYNSYMSGSNDNGCKLTTIIPDHTESCSVLGICNKAITSGAINRLHFGPGKSNQISPISGWGYVSGDTLPNGAVMPKYIKPDLSVRAPDDTTSPTAPIVAGCFAVLLSKDANYLDNIDNAKENFYANHVYPLPGCPNKTHGRGVLFMDWREGWHEPDEPPAPPGPSFDVIVYSNPTSLSKQDILKFGISSPDISVVNAHVFTVTGELVKSFSTEDLNSANGNDVFAWNLENQDGRKVAPGVYFLVAQTNLGKRIEKFALTK
jgi:hypothetical protein